MWRIEKRIDIDQPTELVFDYLSRFQFVREWDTSVVKARKLSPGPPSVGTRFSLTLCFAWNFIPMWYEIVEMDASKRLVLEGSAQGFQALDQIGFEPIASGTRLTYTADITFDQPRPWMIDRALKALFGMYAGKAVQRLKDLLSGSGHPPRLTIFTRLADQAIFPGLVGFTRTGYLMAKRRRPVASTLYAGRTMVITGATSGIGKAAARNLYAKGVRLVAVGRSAEKLDRLSRELLESGKHGSIQTEIADLSLMSEVRQLATRLLQRHDHIDVLINNAGALFNQYEESAEGIEMTLATDLASPFLLTRLLLPALKASPAARIINVASGGMYTQGIDPKALTPDPADYDGPTAYARAKRGLIVLTEAWAKALAKWNVSVHAMHPGWVDTPGLEHALPAFYHMVSAWLRTPSEGADTIVWLSAAPDAAKASGQFWLDRKIRATHVFAHTRRTRGDHKRLIKALESLTGC